MNLMREKILHWVNSSEKFFKHIQTQRFYWSIPFVRYVHTALTNYPDASLLTLVVLIAVGIALTLFAYWSMYALLDPAVSWLMETPPVESAVDATAHGILWSIHMLVITTAVATHSIVGMGLWVAAVSYAMPFAYYIGKELAPLLVTSSNECVVTLLMSNGRVENAPPRQSSTPQLPSRRHGAYLLHPQTQCLLFRA